MDVLQNKGRELSGYLIQLLKEKFADKIEIVTPLKSESRGCQVSFILKDTPTKQIYEKIRKEGVVCDYREPNSIRVAPVPMYNTFTDIYNFVKILSQFC